MSKMTKKKKIVLISVLSFVAALLITAGIILWLVFRPVKIEPRGELDSVSVCLEVPTDGSTPMDHSGIENIGYMNCQLRRQSYWYSEMSGTVDNWASKQTINTFKQYYNGVMIATDIAKSNLVNSAEQYCIIDGTILMRGTTKTSDFNGIDTKWPEGQPTGYTFADFKAAMGLPHTEFSVFVLNENTILNCSDIIDNGDGTYTQTFELNMSPNPSAENDAGYYYKQQMIYKGGLSGEPVFNECTITYTFDSRWQVLSVETYEDYKVKKGIINSNCTATGRTDYRYDDDQLCYNPDYENYFAQYVEEYIPFEYEKKLTAADCLAEAFGGVVQEETALSVNLALDQTELSGIVQLNLPQNDVRLDLGNIKVYLRNEKNDGYLYIAYGENVKAKIALSDLASDDASTEEGDEEENVLDSLLTALGDEDCFAYDKEAGTATISPTINLGELLGIDFDLILELEFKFNVSDESVTLDNLTAIGEMLGSQFNAELRFTDEGVAALTQTEAAEFTKIDVAGLAAFAQAEALQIQLKYSGYDVEVSGGITINLDELHVKADLQLVLGESIDEAKEISLIYANDTIYAELNTVGEQPVKVKASASEAYELIVGFAGITQTQDMDILQTALDFIEEIGAGKLADILISQDGLSGMLELAGGEGALITVDGTALCNIFAVDFELGTVVAEIQNGGTVGLSALGLDATISGAEKFTFDQSEYQSATDLLPIVQKFIGLIEENKLSINGTFTVEAGGASYVIDINLLSVGWSEGVNVILNSVVTVEDISQNLLVSYDGEIAKVSLGNIGILIESADFEDIINAVSELVGAIGVESTAVTQQINVEELDVISLVNSLKISSTEDCIAKLSLFGFEITLIDQTDGELGVLGISAAYEEDGVSLGFDGSLAYYQTEEYPDEAVEYFDVEYVVPIINKVTGYLTESKLTVSGSVEVGGVTVAMDNLAISWADGIEVAARVTLSADSFNKTVYFEYNSEKIALYCDGIVVELAQDDLGGFIEAVQNLYAAITDEVNKDGEVIPSALDIESLLALLPMEDDGEEIDIFEILSSIELAKNESGNLVITYNGLTLELVIASNGDLSVNIEYNAEDTVILANATVTEYCEVVLPSDCYKLDVAELTSLMNDVAEIVTDHGITVSGELTLDAGSTEVDLIIYGLSIGWANGIEFKIDARLDVDGAVHDFYAEYSTVSGQLKIAYGDLAGGAGVDINIVDDAATIEDALVALYNRIAGVVNKTGDVLPEVQDWEELLDLISVGKDAVGVVNELAQTLEDITAEQLSIWDILGAIDINAQDGVFYINAGDLTLILWRADGQFNISVYTEAVGFEIKNLQIVATEATDFDVQVKKALSAEDIADVLDYIGATVELLATDALKIELSGTVTSTDEAYAEVEGNVKYNINAGFEYLQGESGFPVHADTETPDFWIAPDVYVHLYVEMLSTIPEEDSLLLDAYVFDGNPTMDDNGKTTSAELTSGDNELDIYMSISRISQEQANEGNNGESQPLKIYAPMNEIMTVLSAGLALVDVGSISIDALPEINDTIVQIGEILDVMLVDRYFGETKDQFISLGSGLWESIIGGSISDFINDLINGLVGSVEDETGEEVTPVAYALDDGGFNRVRQGLLNLDIQRNETDSALTLSVGETETIVTKQSGKLTSLIIDKVELNQADALNNFAVGISYSGIEKVTELEGYTGFLGADDLVKALINSATHEIPADQQTEESSAKYTLNNSFFIDGELGVTVNLASWQLTDHKVTIDGLSVNIGEDGDVEVNARLHYEGKNVLLITLVDGDSTVDLTIKNGMVYIKRVQTSDFSWGKRRDITPITTYRAMPIDVFTGDIMNQIFFILNFNSSIVDMINSGGDSEPQAEVKKDYGTQLAEYFNWFTFTESEDGAAIWKAQINGTGISDLAGIDISDITATFNAEKDTATDCYVINKLGLSGALFSVLQFSADLNWQNPQQNWRSEGAEELAEEIVQNKPSLNMEKWLGGTSFEEICRTIDWNKLPNTSIVETTDQNGETVNVTYRYVELVFSGDEELPSGKVKFGKVEYYLLGLDGVETQLSSAEDILYSGTTLLSIVEVPDLAEYAIEHYTLEWQASSTAEGLKYVADYIPDKYEVTFISDYEIQGYTHTYGDTLTFNFDYQTEGHRIDYIEYDGVQYTAENYTEIVIDGDAEIYVHWVDVPYITVNYYSEIALPGSEEVGGVEGYESAYMSTVKLSSDFSVEDVGVDGYTFLGWFYLDDNAGWISVEDVMEDIPEATVGKTYELHALWLEVSSVSVTTTVTVSGSIIKTYTYKMSNAGVEFKFRGHADLLEHISISDMKFSYYTNKNGSYSTSNNTNDITDISNENGIYSAKDTQDCSIKASNNYYGNVNVSFNVNVGGATKTCSGEYLHASAKG